ncbi:hypothetical protein KDA06_02395 [Candidatus Saccharibacteria bacterium]|jgi:hypothetical protein|nr:hypothetical protein [Candidatus Saccharibacteria bacterium]HPR09644.1 hypothetical protein [Candidatus Saccharibacteria bacterium]
MTPKRLFYLLLITVSLLFIATISTGYVANSVLSQQAEKLRQLKAESEATQELQSLLQKNKSDIKRYSDLNEIAKAVVPQDKDQALTVREIVKIANDSGITNLTSINFPASTLGGTASGGSQAGGLSQVIPVKGISGVYLLPITVTVDSSNPVSYSQFTTFLQRLEQNRRTAQVSEITITPDPKNPSTIAFVITLNEYIKP